MTPIRIAYVIDTIETPAAGTERQLLALLHGLDRREFAPHLVCLRGSEWLDAQKFDFPLTRLDLRSLLRPDALAALFRFRRLCLDTPFDIVQTFFVDGNLFGTLGAALARRPVVVSSRRNIGHWQDGFHRTLLRGLRRWTDYYLANSHSVAENTREVERVAPERIVFIRNGFEFEAAAPPERRLLQREAWGLDPADLLVGCVANLRPVKNLTEFVDAAAELAPAEPRARFVIVGEGPDREALAARIAERGLTARFRLAGRLLDVRPALSAFDLAVQCSRAESSSNSLIECMAAGLPVVVSDIPGNAEAILHEETGLLYPVGRADSLAAALQRLAGDPVLRDRLGGAARRMALDTYGLARCLENHEAFYRRIAGGRRGA